MSCVLSFGDCKFLPAGNSARLSRVPSLSLRADEMMHKSGRPLVMGKSLKNTVKLRHDPRSKHAKYLRAHTNRNWRPQAGRRLDHGSADEHVVVSDRTTTTSQFQHAESEDRAPAIAGRGDNESSTNASFPVTVASQDESNSTSFSATDTDDSAPGANDGLKTMSRSQDESDLEALRQHPIDLLNTPWSQQHDEQLKKIRHIDVDELLQQWTGLLN